MKKIILPLLILVLMISCSCPGTLTALLNKIRPSSTPEVESNDLLTLISKDRIRVISTRGNLGANSLTGRTVDMELYNNADAPLEVSIPCGVVFIPSDEKSSRMIVVQPLEIQFNTAETKTIKPFVLSTENLKALPTSEKTYRIDMLTEGKQLQLSQCLCKENLSAELETRDLISLQLAAWLLDENSVITNLPDDLNDWFQDLTGLPFTIPGLEDSLQDLAGTLAPSAQAWLNMCGIEQ